MTKKNAATVEEVLVKFDAACDDNQRREALNALTIEKLRDFTLKRGVFLSPKQNKKTEIIEQIIASYHAMLELGKELEKAEEISSQKAEAKKEYDIEKGLSVFNTECPNKRRLVILENLTIEELEEVAARRNVSISTEQPTKDFIINQLLKDFDTVLVEYYKSLALQLAELKEVKDIEFFKELNELDYDAFYRVAYIALSERLPADILNSEFEKTDIKTTIRAYLDLMDAAESYASDEYAVECAVDRLEDLFKELVPARGRAESLAGELIRVATRIGERYNNDGERLGIGWGRETCNPAGRFLRKYGNEKIAASVKDLWTAFGDDAYDFYLGDLVKSVVEYIEKHTEFKNIKSESFYDCADPEQNIYDDDEYDYEHFSYKYEYTPAPLEELLAGVPINSLNEALRLTKEAETLEEVERIFRRCTYEALCKCPDGKKYTKDELVDRCMRLYTSIARIVGKIFAKPAEADKKLKIVNNILEDAVKVKTAHTVHKEA